MMSKVMKEWSCLFEMLLNHEMAEFVNHEMTELFNYELTEFEMTEIVSVGKGINTRLSNISSDRQSFESAIPPYQEALKNSGHDYKLHYNPQPPYNSDVSTNIRHKFLKTTV